MRGFIILVSILFIALSVIAVSASDSKDKTEPKKMRDKNAMFVVLGKQIVVNGAVWTASMMSDDFDDDGSFFVLNRANQHIYFVHVDGDTPWSIDTGITYSTDIVPDAVSTSAE